jgi:hypothetical protein
VYLSDISGAFDKVETDRLLAKLTATGINSTFLQLLRDYLSVREAYVLVNGEKSCKFELANTVFQGTVLGPSLWNIFFKDVTTIPALLNARVAQFADDLTVTKEFPPHTPNAYIMETLRTYHVGAHEWGKMNRVEFDPGKEAFAVIHHKEGEGPDFRLLGPVFDPKLLMHTAIKKVANRARPKMIALLKTKRFYTTKEMIIQFKTHLLCVLESCSAAIYHASESVLDPLNRVVNHFLRDINVDPASAFLVFNLAPLGLRRDIGILGLLHKCTLGLAHPWLLELFPPCQYHMPANTRYSGGRHDRQILERCKGNFLEITRNSLFGLVRVYSFLPLKAVRCTTVKQFQRTLTDMAKQRCADGCEDWQTRFSPRVIRQG